MRPPSWNLPHLSLFPPFTFKLMTAAHTSMKTFMPSHLSLSFPSTKLKTHHTCTLLFLFPFCYNGGRFPPQSLNFFSQNNQQLLWLSSLYFLCHISPYSLCSGHITFWQSQGQTKLFPTPGFWQILTVWMLFPPSSSWLALSHLFGISLNINPSDNSSFFQETQFQILLPYHYSPF